MVYVAHVLPLASDCKVILSLICAQFGSDDFHRRWPLDGWNDDIIQPARDAVVEYYKVHTSTTLLIGASLIQVRWTTVLSAMEIA